MLLIVDKVCTIIDIFYKSSWIKFISLLLVLMSIFKQVLTR